MEINTLRSLVMILGLVLFIAIFFWAWSSKSKKGFDEAANLPFEESVIPPQQNKNREVDV